ncbi:MAG: glycosyltransferase family 4 protein [bacterium]|nr:glycosyltransferase family 4 protein [bacterium]
MRIGIDCRLSGKKHAGIGRYIENLITRLPTLRPDIEWVFFFYDSQQSQALGPVNVLPNVRCVYAPVSHYTLQEQLKMPGIFRRAKLDLLHVPHFNIPFFYSGKILVTIHDLLWHEQQGSQVTTLPTWQYRLKYAAYRWLVSKAISRAEKIVVPAETIKNTIEHYYPHSSKKILVTKEGIGNAFTHVKSPKTKRQTQLLYVGSLYPHKNISVVLDALPLLPEYSLKIVGARNVFVEQVKKSVKEKQLQSQVEFVGYVPDEKLVALLQKSFALVQPSLSEGFGLTGVEAFATGTTVVASDIPIFREIYQQAATYFDPAVPAAFARAIRLLEKENYSHLTQIALAQAKKYSWDSMAKETAASYEK